MQPRTHLESSRCAYPLEIHSWIIKWDNARAVAATISGTMRIQTSVQSGSHAFDLAQPTRESVVAHVTHGHAAHPPVVASVDLPSAGTQQGNTLFKLSSLAGLTDEGLSDERLTDAHWPTDVDRPLSLRIEESTDRGVCRSGSRRAAHRG